MGPFELSDYIGLDVMLQIGEYLTSKLGDKYKPASILRKLVKEGKLGRKTGNGFYDYWISKNKTETWILSPSYWKYCRYGDCNDYGAYYEND